MFRGNSARTSQIGRLIGILFTITGTMSVLLLIHHGIEEMNWVAPVKVCIEWWDAFVGVLMAPLVQLATWAVHKLKLGIDLPDHFKHILVFSLVLVQSYWNFFPGSLERIVFSVCLVTVALYAFLSPTSRLFLPGFFLSWGDNIGAELWLTSSVWKVLAFFSITISVGIGFSVVGWMRGRAGPMVVWYTSITIIRSWGRGSATIVAAMVVVALTAGWNLVGS